MGLSHFVLSLGLLLNELIYKLLVRGFICLSLLVVLLKLDDFPAALSSLGILNVLKSLLPSESSIEKFFVSGLLGLGLDGSEFSLGGVVIDELEVPLPVEDELLSVSLLVGLDLLGPLVLQHVLLPGLLAVLNLLGLRDGILLPGEDVQSLLHLLFLGRSLILLPLDLLLVVEHPEFGVDLLLDNGLFELGLFVHKLLLPLDLGSSDHEGGLLLPQVVGLHLELALEGVLHQLGSLFLSLRFQGVESLGHLGSDLFWSLESSHELLLVHLILRGQNCRKSTFTGLQISRLSFLHISDSVSNNILSNNSICFDFPLSFKFKILITSNSILKNCIFCFVFSSSVNMAIKFEFL